MTAAAGGVARPPSTAKVPGVAWSAFSADHATRPTHSLVRQRPTFTPRPVAPLRTLESHAITAIRVEYAPCPHPAQQASNSIPRSRFSCSSRPSASGFFAWMVGSQARAKGYGFTKFFVLALFFSPFALSAALHVLPGAPAKGPTR